MRILWLSNAPWVPSGYGEQTALFVRMLQADGHDVAVACNYGLQGAPVDWRGIVCYPTDVAWGNESLGIYADHWRADLVIALTDAWVLTPDRWPDGLRAAVWAPVDHYPIPPKVLASLESDRITPIAMSRFGERMMRDAGLEPLFVPHGVDTDLFHPRPELHDQVRDEVGVPRDAFLVGMVAANVGNAAMPRKGWPCAFEAFGEFSRAHEDAFMYVHAHPKASRSRGGVNLGELADQMGCRAGSVRFPSDEMLALGVAREGIAGLYQAVSVLLMPSMGEGFGIPLIESQACGVPVITSDHSAMTELGEAGRLIRGRPLRDCLQDSWFLLADPGDAHDALEEAYAARDDPEPRDRAVAFARRYDARTVYEEYWRPAIKVLSLRAEVLA